MSTPFAERESLNLQPRHRWTVAEYHRMGEVGLLNEDSRVELIFLRDTYPAACCVLW